MAAGKAIATAVAVISWLLCASLHAQEMVVGVNVVNPMRASVADQNTLLGQLKAGGVRVIRCGISDDDKGIDFAKRAAAHGIRIQLIVSPQYPPNAATRAYEPDEFPAMWGGHPLSFADVTLSKTAFQRLPATRPPPPRIDSSASTISPGTRIRGQSNPTRTACIVAGHSPRAVARRSRDDVLGMEAVVPWS